MTSVDSKLVRYIGMEVISRQHDYNIRFFNATVTDNNLFLCVLVILGPTLKLRRPIVAKMYKELIDGFYAN